MRVSTAALLVTACTSSACGSGAAASSEAVVASSPTTQPTTAGPPPGAWFVDVAERAGVRHQRHPLEYVTAQERFSGGVCLLDVDGDGRLDLFFPGASHPRASGPHLYVMRPGGEVLRYVDETVARGLADVGDGRGCLAFDVDGDGDSDLLVTGLGGARLFRNDDGRFVDVSSRLGSPFSADTLVTAAVAFDADGDGDLDLAIGAFGRYRSPAPGTDCGTQPCVSSILRYDYGGGVLLLQGDDGTFTTTPLPHRKDPTLVMLATDLDDDGRIDLFVGNDMAAFEDRYYVRDPSAEGRWVDVAPRLGVAWAKSRSGISSMSAFDADVDGDGMLDLVESSNDSEPNPLFRCTLSGEARCVDVADELELFRTPKNFRWGQALVDFDGDGVLELFEAVGHYDLVRIGESLDPDVRTLDVPLLWHRKATNAPFAIAPPIAGLAVRTGGRGVVVADLDDDGDLDVVVGTALGRPMVLENVHPRAGNTLRVALAGKGKNRQAIGAKITVRAGGKSHPAIVHAGLSFLSSGDPRVSFGVGAAKTVSIDVRWPNGTTTHLDDVPASGTVKVTEP